jgi:ABC-type transporter Mla subunit MlaD
MEKQIEGSNKNIMDRMRMMTEIIKSLKEKNSEYDEKYIRTDTILRTLANNQKSFEENLRQVKENNTNNPNVTNEIGSINKNVETLSQNLTENVEVNAKRSKKIIEKLAEIAEENKSYQQKLKEIIIALKRRSDK